MGNIYPTLNYMQIYFIMHNLAIKLRVQHLYVTSSIQQVD